MPACLPTHTPGAPTWQRKLPQSKLDALLGLGLQPHCLCPPKGKIPDLYP